MCYSFGWCLKFLHGLGASFSSLEGSRVDSGLWSKHRIRRKLFSFFFFFLVVTTAVDSTSCPLELLCIQFAIKKIKIKNRAGNRGIFLFLVTVMAASCRCDNGRSL